MLRQSIEYGSKKRKETSAARGLRSAVSNSIPVRAQTPLTVRVNDKTFQGWNVDLCLVALMVGRLETP